MSEAANLTVHEQAVADAYGSSGQWPEDPHERRILDYLITSGQVKETGLASEVDPAEPGSADEVEQAPGDEQLPAGDAAPATPADVEQAAGDGQSFERAAVGTVKLAETIAAARSFELHGAHEVVRLSSPAAGNALNYVVPGAVQQLIEAVSFTFTASAQAANRIPFVEFLDQSGIAFASVATPYKLVATNVGRVTFGVGVQQFGADSAARIGAGIPAMVLEDGLAIRLSAVAIDAADTITDARLFVRQWRVSE